MKKFVSLIITVLFTVTLSTSAFAESAGFKDESTVINAGTPYDKSYVEIRFSTGESETAGVPLAYKEFLLSPAGNRIDKIDGNTGETLISAELSEKVSESLGGAITNGVLYQPARTTVFAVELENMSVKCSRQFGEIITDIAAIDGLIYFGVRNNDGYSFICADAEKNLEKVWEYKSENAITSAGLFGEYIVFASGNKLICHSKTDDDFKENEIAGTITNVYAGKYAVFMTAEGGTLYKVRLEADGTVEDGSLMSLEIGGELSAPAEKENKLFVSSTNGFYAVDALNMDVIKAYPDLKNGCDPVITTGSGFRAYVAAPVPSEGKWYLYSVLDNDDVLTLSEIVKINDFTNGKISVSDSGVMYFRDAKGHIYALGIRENDIFTIILKIVIFIAIMVFLFLILRAWIKKHSDKTPKFT
ncbi:MAG: hypothetical protein J1F04_04995 [Oscillospiraceae bacterium]|nr:hypothetical protein [Oscillospiraceae bacterium]